MLFCYKNYIFRAITLIVAFGGLSIMGICLRAVILETINVFWQVPFNKLIVFPAGHLMQEEILGL